MAHIAFARASTAHAAWMDSTYSRHVGQTGRIDRAASTQSAIRTYGSFMGAL